MPRTIAISDYRDTWPAIYSHESASIRSVFGPDLISIEHIGSTSVLKMRAKPIIDILAIVIATSDITSFYSDMHHFGYDCRGECLDAPIPGTPGRYYFSKDLNGLRYSHVHVCHLGHRQIQEFLALRDFLRAHPIVAKEYGDLKSNLAQRFPDDNYQYMTGKNEFVKQLIAMSLAWQDA